MSDAPDASPARARWSHWDWLFVAVGLLLWLDRFTPPVVARGMGLDLSWQVALSYFQAHDLRAGVDWVFTYGPLGFCETGDFLRGQFWPRVLAWEFAFELAGVAVLIGAARSFPRRWQGALFLGVYFFLRETGDTHWMLVATALAALCLGARTCPWPAFVAACVIATVISLVKFAWAPVALFSLLCCVYARARKRPRIDGVVAVAVACAIYAAVWMLTGQRLGDLFTYFRNSLEVSRGYPEAMGAPYPEGFAIWSAVTVVLACSFAAASALVRPRSVDRVLVALCVIGGAVIAYKASAVRQGQWGPSLTYAALALCFLAREHERWPLAAARWACIAFAVSVAVHFQGGWQGRFDAAVYQRRAEWTTSLARLEDLRGYAAGLVQQLTDEQHEFAMPRTRAVIGDAPVDFMGDHQALLLRNAFNYRPRPVFQSYVAYSPQLVKANERYYSGPDAPPFVIQTLPITDDQLTSGLDGGALAALFARYEPVLCERGFTLWKLVDGAPPLPPTAPPTIMRAGRIGEWIKVAGEGEPCRWMRLQLRWSLAGKLAREFAHPSWPYIELRTNDGDVVRRRIVPALARQGFMIDPVLRSQGDLLRWIARETVPRVLAIRVVVDAEDAYAFEPDVRVDLSPRPEIVPRSPPDARAKLVYPMFSPAPIAASMPPAAYYNWIYNRWALFVLAPSELRFAVAPGEHKIHGVFGMGGDEQRLNYTDGVRFDIGVGDGPPLFSKMLDPSHVHEDRRAQPFTLEFSVDEPSELWLRTDPGPKGDGGCDDAYWTSVAIDADTSRGAAQGVRRKKRGR